MKLYRMLLLLLVSIFIVVGGVISFGVEPTPSHAWVAAMGICHSNNLEINIYTGEAPFTITGNGPGLPVTNVTIGTKVTLTGPSTWSNVVVTDNTGETYLMGAYQCPIPNLGLIVDCHVDPAGNHYLQIGIYGGEGPFRITGTGSGLPFTATPAAQIIQLPGPAEWRDVVITEGSGDMEQARLGHFACGVPMSPPYPTPPPPSGPPAFVKWLECNGSNMVLRAKNAPVSRFQIYGTGPGILSGSTVQGGQSMTLIFDGPGTWQNVTLRANIFDPESSGTFPVNYYFGSITCYSPEDPLPPGAPVEPAPSDGAAPVVFSNEYGVPRMVELATTQPTVAYDAPNGNPISIDGVPLQLPSDADANGYDTYVVVGVVEIEGVLWVALDVGGDQPVYIKADY